MCAFACVILTLTEWHTSFILVLLCSVFSLSSILPSRCLTGSELFLPTRSSSPSWRRGASVADLAWQCRGHMCLRGGRRSTQRQMGGSAELGSVCFSLSRFPPAATSAKEWARCQCRTARCQIINAAEPSQIAPAKISRRCRGRTWGK